MAFLRVQSSNQLQRLAKCLACKSFDFQRKYHTAVMVYKSINGLALECLSNLFTNRDSVTSNSPRDTESKVAIPQLQGGVQCCGIASKSSCGRQTLCTVLKRLTLANFYPIDSESFVQLQRHGSHGKQAYTVYTLFYLFSFITFAVADTGEGHGGPPLFLDQNGGLKGRKIFLETGPPLISGSG